MSLASTTDAEDVLLQFPSLKYSATLSLADRHGVYAVLFGSTSPSMADGAAVDTVPRPQRARPGQSDTLPWAVWPCLVTGRWRPIPAYTVSLPISFGLFRRLEVLDRSRSPPYRQ